ncbi:hypothetical protein P22_2776 [Propionispora sp. 2/2-37]|uniref:ketohydroxyglutarate aldolase n=1 Tax=Propionispora sp. 2/2-37 TaxID=1677858 RepID=UPI0006BB6A29|nr:ketohydroxyglutarate aldolase [Propionispora sp. 2/2-37]CUH96686.1 hypothetical protein P22_2776 [Propionispora sp. 2/2-37]
MLKPSILNHIEATGAMAIVRTETVERGIEIAEGCLAGGVDVMEISYTLPNASDVIRALIETFGDKLIAGAGTVLDGETARLAIIAGAKFVIAPNFSKEVARVCNRYMIPYMPGCTSVTEAVKALEAGASMIKAFPISNFYGPKLISIFKTPIPYMPILASGGVTVANIPEWIRAGCECLGVGGLLMKGTKEEIMENAKQIRMQIDKTRKK